jgi:16S rRNA (guanine966-N2)-methyltransferase
VTRIIAGKARGRRLSVPAAGTRPTADRVRESLFSSLDSALAADGIAWSSVSILDLFAGSGALGLEALSRGAAEAVLVEKARPALVVLKRNIEAVGLPGAVVLAKDARALAQDPPQVSAGLVFADPPYDWSAEALAALLNGLGESGWVSPGATVVVERPAKDPLSPLPSSWDQGRRRAYGDTALWYGRLTLPERG